MCQINLQVADGRSADNFRFRLQVEHGERTRLSETQRRLSDHLIIVLFRLWKTGFIVVLDFVLEGRDVERFVNVIITSRKD